MQPTIMKSLSLYSPAAAAVNTTTTPSAPLDPAVEIARLETLLSERRHQLATLREGFSRFKTRYTQVVGTRLAELEEVERMIKAAEERTLGTTAAADSEQQQEDSSTTVTDDSTEASPLFGTSLRNLFWSVAKIFHPDRAADEKEAKRRHTVMAEASRAYREGDIDSLHILLGDQGLQSYCVGAHRDDGEEDLTHRLLRLKEELRTIEFGCKRIRQDGLYRVKLSIEKQANNGRDALAEMAERISRQIVKARRRLEHLS